MSITLQDSLIINISGWSQSVSSIFCIKIVTKKEKFYWFEMARSGQPHPSLPGVALFAFGWSWGYYQIRNSLEWKAIDFEWNNCAFSQFNIQNMLQTEIYFHLIRLHSSFIINLSRRNQSIVPLWAYYYQLGRVKYTQPCPNLTKSVTCVSG